MQAQLFELSFDKCNLTSSLGNSKAVGDPICDCGVLGECITFDGIDDGITLPDTLVDFLEKDFTIDFYIDIDNKGTDQVDILAIGNDCGIDSLITIEYIRGNKEILVELFINNGIYFPIRGKINTDLCWNRISLVRSELKYTLYINNVEQNFVIATQNIPISKNAKFTLSNGICLASVDDRFSGKMDEFKFYTSALAQRELVQSYAYPDKIITADTTIYANNIVNLKYGNTCATTFEWFPNTGLDKDDVKDVVASPTTTTTYTITAISKECISKDDVTIYVIDPEKEDCNKILLPSAFTPNGDQVNDIFKISNVFIIEELKSLEILDRWGEVLFKTTNKNEGWDGNYKDKNAEPALYVYRVEYTCKGESYNKLGNLVLLK